MNCKEFQTIMMRTMPDGGDPETERQISEHLESCKECEEWLNRLDQKIVRDPLYDYSVTSYKIRFFRRNDPNLS